MVRPSLSSVSTQGTGHEAGRHQFYASGTFANKWIRAEVSEVQKGDGVPKTGDNDISVLDPPPIARVRLYECTPNGVVLGEVDYRTLEQVQVTCMITLSPRQTTPSGPIDPPPSNAGTQGGALPLPNVSVNSEATFPVGAGTRLMQNFDAEAKVFDQEKLGTWAVAAVVAPVPGAHTNVQTGLYCGFDDLRLSQPGFFAAHYRVFLYDFGDPVEPQRRFFSIAECFGAVFLVVTQPSTLAHKGAKTLLTDHMERHGVISASPRYNSLRELLRPTSPSSSDPASSSGRTHSMSCGSGHRLSLSGSLSRVTSAVVSPEGITDVELALGES
ncbi:hypothetical protein BKA62DRAFT_55155 [Auriculariales sp. MPI-PUGE-AT-0066]|nr:hypothetical protein BKA62DRAFT_55155 [Auriculariales sp. MPI-PUGE-AT-0066]